MAKIEKKHEYINSLKYKDRPYCSGCLMMDEDEKNQNNPQDPQQNLQQLSWPRKVEAFDVGRNPILMVRQR